MAAIKCNQCGENIPEGHTFCGGCGAQISKSTSSMGPDTDFFSALQTPGRAKLIVVRGEGEGISYALNAMEHVAGRASGVILFPDDDTLSKQHCDFRYRDEQLYLNDRDSQNGTYLRIREPVHLADGDLFSCGQQLLQVNLLNDTGEFPSGDGTLYYTSPNRHEKLRVTQIIEGGKAGTTVSSPVGELTVGREGCDLTVGDDSHLSGRHAKLSLGRDGRVELSDLGSKNGTYIRIKGEVRLTHGDYVFIGKELLRVEIVE
jgi:pSer/pThr/pTyr-binding forkhead associated (FHA) protein